jgi:hypothetical protein
MYAHYSFLQSKLSYKNKTLKYSTHSFKNAYISTRTKESLDKILSLYENILARPCIGRAVAQAVSRWLSIAAARVRVRAACGVCGQSDTGAGFLRVVRFHLQIIAQISQST